MTTRPAFELFPAKLTVPPQRDSVIQRRALLRRLQRETGKRLVTVVAPAGYGKTTLLAQWSNDDPRPFAWVSVDRSDNDPVVLLTYIAAALDASEPIEPRVFRGLNAGDSLGSTGLPRLGSALMSRKKPFVLVLDDVHELCDTPAIDALVGLAHHVPSGSQLVLAGRCAGGLPLARIRAGGELLELGPPELSLSDGEARALLLAAAVRPSQPEVTELNAHAEGWAAGLYLAALAVQAESGPLNISDFAGDDRFVTDYLWSEHLSRMKDADVEFLTRTSVLDRMSAPLCDAVLGRDGSAEKLAGLEQANLFVVALDHHRGWYRYHHLFRDMLQAELARREPDNVSELNLRAAVWCADNELPAEAIDYAVAAGDLDRVAALFAQQALPYYRSGRVATVERWLTAFEDPRLVDNYPEVAVLAAMVHALRGRPSDAERWFQAVESSEYGGPMPDGSRSLRPWAALLRALLCRHGIDRMRADAELAIAELSAVSPWQPVASSLRGVAMMLAEDYEQAGAIFAEAAEAAKAVGATYAAVVACSELALLAIGRNDLDAAESELRAARALAESRPPDDYAAVAIMHGASARLALARGKGAAAREDLVRAQRLRPLLTYALPWLSVQSMLELAHVHVALSDAEGARTLILEIDDVLHLRPELGVLVDQAGQLREELAAFTAASSGWPSTLTAAELRLLPLLTTHLSFREIAERLYVSRNTVKTQAISVYRKLGATTRSEAVSRAVALGLVDAAPAI